MGFSCCISLRWKTWPWKLQHCTMEGRCTQYQRSQCTWRSLAILKCWCHIFQEQDASESQHLSEQLRRLQEKAGIVNCLILQKKQTWDLMWFVWFVYICFIVVLSLCFARSVRLASFCIATIPCCWQRQQDGHRLWFCLRRRLHFCFEREFLQSFEVSVVSRICLCTEDLLRLSPLTLLLCNSKRNNFLSFFCSCCNNRFRATMMEATSIGPKPHFS